MVVREVLRLPTGDPVAVEAVEAYLRQGFLQPTWIHPWRSLSVLGVRVVLLCLLIRLQERLAAMAECQHWGSGVMDRVELEEQAED